LLCCACKKEDVLPAITMEGKNTLGFRVNGAIWIPKGSHSGVGADMTGGPNFLSIGGDSRNSSILILLSDTIPIAAKTYILSNVRPYTCYYNVLHSGDKNCEYDPVNVVNGKLVISRLSGDIVSGTFELKMYKPTCKNDTLRITDGRFDLKIDF